MTALSFAKKDYYELLGLSSNFTEKQLKKAHRELARVWHPDKNPAPEAGDVFQLIQKAYEVLSNAEEKEKYDEIRNKKHRQEIRRQEMDGKRRRMKSDLEEKERAWKRRKTEEDRQRYEEQYERSRKAKEQAAKEQREREEKRAKEESGENFPVHVSWSKRKGHYTPEDVRTFLRNYGHISAIRGSESAGERMATAAAVNQAREAEKRAGKRSFAALDVPSIEEHQDFEKQVLERLRVAAIAQAAR